jgi:hypothetical protein
MLAARVGEDKRKIDAKYYRKEKHGDPICLYCDEKVTYRKGKTPHFMVTDRKEHSCPYYSDYVEQIVLSLPQETVDLRRSRDNGTLVFNLDFEKETTKNEAVTSSSQNKKTTGDNDNLHPILRKRVPGSNHSLTRLKTNFKFIQDIYDFIRRNERDQVLKCSFMVMGQKLKGEELIPKFSDILKMNEIGSLHHFNRFLLGKVLNIRTSLSGHIHVTLKGQKFEGKFINAKMIFMKPLVDQLGLNESDFFLDRLIMFYGKPQVKVNKKGEKEIIAFIHQSDEFEFGKIMTNDGDFVDSFDEMHIDNFLNHQLISHYIPTLYDGKELFSVENGVDQFYVPDWILYINKITIVEYFGFYTDEYKERKKRKIEYYSKLPDYEFLALEKEDLLHDFHGLKEKLLRIDPDLKLKHFEFRGS